MVFMCYLFDKFILQLDQAHLSDNSKPVSMRFCMTKGTKKAIDPHQ